MSCGRKTSQESWSKIDLEDPLDLSLQSNSCIATDDRGKLGRRKLGRAYEGLGRRKLGKLIGMFFV